MPVYSIAKPYTAAAACLSLDLDEAVGTLLPDIPANLASLTVRDLLAHRSGLNDYASWPDYREAVRRRDAPWPASEILSRAEVGEPGVFRYSNIGFLLLRLALEETRHGDFFGVLDELVFSPLGIPARPFAAQEDWRWCDHPAIGQSLRGYHPGWVYTGTFIADPHEAARGLALIMRGLLGNDVATEMRRPLPVDAPASHPMSPGAGYGLGLMTRGNPAAAAGHGGQGPGFNLFAATSADGSRWQGAVEAAEGENVDLIRACIEAVLHDGSRPPGP